MIENLVNYLKSCDDAYYNSANPLVPDSTYDALVETLRKLCPTNPYLQKIGAKVRSNTVGRLIPMGTLSKYHEEEEVVNWLNSEGGEILLSPKYDGFAVELLYDHGILVSASTRGDGFVGEDVTSAIMKIQSIPHKLSRYHADYTIVRGEVIIPEQNHKIIKDLGYTAMRNAVPGIVRSGRVDALSSVDFIAYEFIDGEEDRVKQRMYYVYDNFYIEDYVIYDHDDITSMKLRRDRFREVSYEYELDGVVLKTRYIKEDNLLNPAHMIAWKYKSNRESTVLREIEFNVGAAGNISVIGIFDPVEFQGAKLTRASFGSLDLYRKMAPCIGDIIEVSRRGDIIPWIEGVLYSESNEFNDLRTCPCCDSILVDDRCTNSSCPERVKLKVLQYIQTLKVKGIGKSLVEGLIEHNMIHSLSDIYIIDSSLILSIPRQGESTVAKWRILQQKRMNPLEFLCAYPIENVGKSIWESLLKRFSIREIISLSKEDLYEANIKGIGESKINSIVTQLQDSKEELLRLLDILEF